MSSLEVLSRARSARIRSPDGVIVPVMDLGHIFAWVCEVDQKKVSSVNPIVIAAVGRPSAPLYPPLLAAIREYWQSRTGEAIGYGPLPGLMSERERMAKALSVAYNVPVDPETVMFTVGGHHALAATFSAYRFHFPEKYVVSSLPYYPAHTGWSEHPNRMLFADVLSDGANFTAAALSKALENVSKDEIGMFCFCTPNNPCGYIITKAEWLKMIPILEQYPKALILLDEAYMEMSYDPFVSLFSLAPAFHERIILVRSATKGFSASGERMAVAVVGSAKIREKMREYIHESNIHAPQSGQYAYSRAMEQFDSAAQQKLARHYEPMVRAVSAVLAESGLAFKHPKYHVGGTFYVLSDFTVLKGRPIHPRAAEVFVDPPTVISTDVEAVFHLLFAHGIAFAPMSLYGVDPSLMLLRITCSCGDDNEMKVMLDRLKAVAAMR